VNRKKVRRVTSKQVAEHAGVSQTTVSFVLNNVEDANISEETKARVLRSARELNYIPDVAAQSLARGRSNNIAFVIARPHAQVFIDEYVPNLLTGMTSVARQNGFRIMVELTERDEVTETCINLLGSNEAAGILVNLNSPSITDIPQLAAITADHLPIVSLGNVHPDVYSVEVNKLGGVRTMLRHLLSLGHQRIACISYAPLGNKHADERVQVVREVLAKTNCPMDEALIGYGAYDPSTGYEVMRKLLKVSPPPTALFGLNDMMAIGATRAIQEFGLRVPQDIAVVGFDDVRVAQFMTPPLTTMNEPDIDHGRLAAESLMALIRGETPSQRHIQLETRLVVRESCGERLQGN
jgi:DNA-binding LacI/PurR family transcriptional regulator